MAALQWLKLESLEIYSEGVYSYKLTFIADSEQIADGLFQEMVYYQRRDRPLPFYITSINAFEFELKFSSPEAFENVISQNFRSIFSENDINFSLPCSKDTIMLLAANGNLINLVARLGYKISMQKSDFLEFIEESSLENIPKIKDLLKSPFLDLDILSNINVPSNFVKIEKFTDSNLIDIVNQALNSLQRPLNTNDYFGVRSALIYLMDGPNRHLLNELPSLIKESLVREFPAVSDIITIY